MKASDGLVPAVYKTAQEMTTLTPSTKRANGQQLAFGAGNTGKDMRHGTRGCQHPPNQPLNYA